MPKPKLISTDFDGTLVDPEYPPETFLPLWEYLRYLQQEHGVLWAINTGRDLAFTIEGLQAYEVPHRPDFLLTMEREIHLPGESGAHHDWQPHLAWNDRCRADHLLLESNIAHQLQAFHDFLEKETAANAVFEEGKFVGIEASSEQELSQIVLGMENYFEGASEFSYQRNGIYLRFCHHEYHKGATLRELTRMLDLEPALVCAAGDNFNDLAMLEPGCAEHLICPVNAIPEVREQVNRYQGQVSQKVAGQGVLEALQKIFTE